MKHNQTLRLSAVTLGLIGAVASGCSGINASKSVSPMDFLLPGLHIQNSPPSPAIPIETNTMLLLAQASPLAR